MEYSISKQSDLHFQTMSSQRSVSSQEMVHVIHTSAWKGSESDGDDKSLLSRKKFDWIFKRRGSCKGVFSKMTDGRMTDIVLLDDKHLEIVIQPKLFAYELLDMVASHFMLKEKNYFGLTYRDETGHYQWLQLERRVLEHEFPKKTGTVVLYFQVRLYIDSISFLIDRAAIELFYLQSMQCLYKGQIETDCETIFELAAYVLQATYGDYIDDSLTRNQIKKLPLLSTRALQEYPSLGYCEDQVILHYRKLTGHTRGSAIVNYMSIVQSLPSYGVHYYEVKDKGGIPWWLGIGFKGLALYDHTDRGTPRKIFAWKLLENLYFRDKKFSIEVTEQKRDSVGKNSSASISIAVHTWIASTTHLARCIWTMTVSQHQFYLDRKHFKSQTTTARSLTDIAAELNCSTPSLSSSAISDDMLSTNSATNNYLIMSPTTDTLKHEMTMKDYDTLRAVRMEAYMELKARKEALENKLRLKMEKLREICLKEADLTGVIPPELPLIPGEQIPQVRKRVGTSFAFSPKFLSNEATDEGDGLASLEMAFEIQDNITTAALKLAQDKSTPKTIRKKHRQAYHREHHKLKELEEKINILRQQAGQALLAFSSKSIDDLSEDSREFLDDDVECDSLTNNATDSPDSSQPRSAGYQRQQGRFRKQQPQYNPNNVENFENHSLGHQSGSCPSLPEQTSSPGIKVYPKKKINSNTNPRSCQNRIESVHGPPSAKIYNRDSTPTTPTTSRSWNQCPKFVQRRSVSPVPSDQTNSCSSSMSSLQQNCASDRGSNLYNISTYTMGYYESGDELKTPSVNSDSYMENTQTWPSKHGSLDRRRSGRFNIDVINRSGSIELPELTPSKYGSKRDSAVDYRDSPFRFDEPHLALRGETPPWNSTPLTVHKENSETGSTYSGLSRCRESDEDDFQMAHHRASLMHQQSPPRQYVAPFPGRNVDTATFERLSMSQTDSIPVHQMFSPKNRIPPPYRESYTPAANPDGPEHLRRVYTDPIVHGPVLTYKPSARHERNDDAVDALFKHYEDKLVTQTYPYATGLISPTGSVPRRTSDVGLLSPSAQASLPMPNSQRAKNMRQNQTMNPNRPRSSLGNYEDHRRRLYGNGSGIVEIDYCSTLV